jgi:NAD(P)-dependent dehydrogenase (short-subunit alcohol dehydrogenase family)
VSADVGTLDGSVAVVTGAAGGLGGAIVDALLRAGATPVLLDVAGDALEDAARAIEREQGQRPGTIPCDVTDPAAIEDAAAWVERRHGRCDVLVNNAAILERSPLEEHPVDLWDRVLAVNVRGYFLCTQAFGRLMIAAGSGSIVNVASLAGESPSFGNGAYCASKAGVLALTRQTAVEWGPRGIRANAVSPSFMRTPMMAGASPEFEQQRTHNVPLGRIAETSEVAGAVVFLAGPGASYLNGVNVPVDGALAQARAAGWDGPAR